MSWNVSEGESATINTGFPNEGDNGACDVERMWHTILLIDIYS